MKLLNKYLAAGSLAAIVLFAYKERFDIHSFFNPKTNQAEANKKIDILSQPATQLPKTIPLISNAKNVENRQNRIVSSNKQQVAATYKSVTGELTAGSCKADVFLQHAVVLPYKQVVFKERINTGAINMQLKTIAPANDSTILESIAKTIETPEDIALENTQAAEQEMSILKEEKVEIAPSVTEPQRTGGNSYQGGTIDISAFASIRKADNGADSYSYAALYDETEELKEYAARSGNNTDYAIIVNLGLKSGKKRLFVIDLSSNTIIKTGLVAEGSGDVHSTYEKKYSNEIGSMSSSLGIFKIGKRTKKDAYRLHGLQESNSNAYKRSMILQASEDVPNDEINFPTLKTNGSLSLSNSFFNEISTMLDESVKPVLLFVYDPSADSQPLYSAIRVNKLK